MNKILITNTEKVQPKHKNEHEPYEYKKYELTPRGEQCYVCIYELPPLKASYPYHYHTANTEVFYIISGSGEIKTPDGIKTIIAGDVIVCPPCEAGAHKIINTSESEPLRYLDCDTTISPDVIFYPDSGKLGTIVPGISSRFFEVNSEVEYYKGE